MTRDPADAVREARERAASRHAEDPTVCWHRDGARLTTHLVRRDGSWSLYRSEGDEMTEVARGGSTT